ncbi:LTA synthase family protein [Metabacillus indicus]|uniref:LTA synthase family protein n=1 Tax=Metabacillus indicus TaxID=246786 RepID=UPI002A098488|nr:LTA synthase family protein [Metabacillus indicus]MDX8292242.1 LTA synthase family protein [Metabacillus indicus]
MFLFFTIVFTISGFWFLKSLYFVHELGMSPHKKFILTASAGLALCLAALLATGRSIVKFTSVFLIYFLLSLLLYADVLYERYYDGILNLKLAGQAGQLGDVKDSILSLVYQTDYLYWADVPAVASVLIFCYWLKTEEVLKWQSRAIFAAGAAALIFTSFFPFKETFSDQYKVSLTGILPAHIYDFKQMTVNEAFANETFVGDKKKTENLQAYFRKNQELQKNSPYFGKFKGKNVIMVQAESLNVFPVGLTIDGAEITPNLDKLIKESQYYPNTYLQIGRGNTSDAEFVANNSIYPMAPKGVYNAFPENNYLSLGNILKGGGYTTSATHGNIPDFWNREAAYDKQGYETFYHKNHSNIASDEIIGMGISDESIFRQMTEIYASETKPFYSFIVSLTNHRPFVMPEEYRELDLPDRFDDTNTGHYLQSVHYFDKTLGLFIQDLKEKGLWDESIFVVYGDHYGPLPMDEKEINNLLGVPFDEKAQFNIPLIIHHPGQKDGTVNEVTASQMDIAPTITSLLGIEQPLIQFGKPLDTVTEGFAGFAYETTRYSFYSDKYDYAASHTGNFKSGKCIDNRSGKVTDVEACRENYEKLVQDIEWSSMFLENDLLLELFNKY